MHNLKINSTSAKIVKAFIIINMLSYFLIMIIPIEAINDHDILYLTITMLFITTTLVGSFLFYAIFSPKNFLPIKKGMSLKQLLFNMKITSYFSLIGLILVTYDRIFIRGISYSEGNRIARYQWLDSDGGSIYSIVGNLLVPLGYVGILFLITHFRCLTKKDTLIFAPILITSVIGYSYINGSRSGVLLALLMIIITLILSSKAGLIKILFRMLVKYIYLIIPTFFYFIYVTSQSVDLGHGDIKNYLESSIGILNAEKTQTFDTLAIFGDILYYLIFMLVYLFHGKWSLESVFSLSSSDFTGSYLFYSYHLILNRFGLLPSPEISYFTDKGYFLTLPGAFYYDAGIVGVIIFSLILGFLLSRVYIMLKFKNINGIRLSFIVFLMLILFLSPVLPAWGFGTVNFIIFSIFALGVVNLLVFKKSTCWITLITR